jgi:hypothetical protein
MVAQASRLLNSASHRISFTAFIILWCAKTKTAHNSKRFWRDAQKRKVEVLRYVIIFSARGE